MVLMRIVSMNIRGLGDREKRTVVRDLISKERVDFICIQETKLEFMDDRMACLLWGWE